MQYDLYKRVLEWRPPSRDAVGYQQYMRHDYNEGGAEYLRIINHSTDKIVEFFIAGGQDMPDTIEGSNIYGETFSGSYFLPSVKYKKAPVQYLLFPDRKPKYNFSFYKDLYTFDGNQCGDITVTEPWTTDMVNNLYRAEYGRSEKIILFVDNKPERMVDQFPGKIFWSSIQPEETFQGSDKIWLLATNGIMFQDERDTAFQ
ncbi:MAG: hypothetical protein LBU18_01675 [Treponema sp.]|nr:hypothetical protein [Treponema sp.]